MKKLILLVTVMLTIATTSFSINKNVCSAFSKMNNKTTFKYITNYLNVNETQANELESIFSITEQKLESAMAEDSELLAENAISYNFDSAKAILTQAQYRKYLLLINLSVNNSLEN